MGWRAITFLLLIAFAFQSYVTQTHIHGTSAAPAQTCTSECAGHSPLHRLPFDSAIDCPLCQAVVHAGSFFVPAALAVFVPRLWVESTLPAAMPFALRVTPARDGLSRAPPR